MCRARSTAVPLRALASAFQSDADGNVAVIFAIVSILLVSVIGAAVDFSRVWLGRAELQRRLDSALTAAMQMPPEARIAAAEESFDTISTGSITKIESRFETATDGLKGTATADVPATLSSLLGIKSVAVSAAGEAMASPSGPTPVGPGPSDSMPTP
jgi:Flp pilus assembly protein TadG